MAITFQRNVGMLLPVPLMAVLAFLAGILILLSR